MTGQMEAPDQRPSRDLPLLSFRWADIAWTAIVAMVFAIVVTMNVLVGPTSYDDKPPPQRQQAS